MTEALKAAYEDTAFQFFLAKLFGQPIEASEAGITVRGYAFRGYLYFTEEVIQDKPDSHE
jgi:hypothetical protein